MTPDYVNDSDNGAGQEQSDWFLPQDSVKQLGELFANMKDEVTLELFTQDGYNDPYNEFCVNFTRDLARLSPRIKVNLHLIGSAQATKREVTHSPTILISPDKYAIRFTGAPVGEEGRSFLTAIMQVSLNKSGLSAASEGLLAELQEQRAVKVFVTPNCPYCPGQVLNAIKAAIARPDLVSAESVEIDEHPDLAEKYGVGSVPQTNYTESFGQLGLMPEERFILELVTGKDAEKELRKGAVPGMPQAEAGEPGEFDLVIVGAGPGGLTAGIYAERSGLKTIILEKAIVGGQVATTPVVENYPGYASIPGKTLMDIMSEHARQYARIHEGEGVNSITRTEEGFELTTDRGIYTAKAVILSTGATYRKLGAPGEEKYFGRGVNYCASCDGYLYKSKRVAVVGGGNTALTDALYMKNLGIEVTIIHRRDVFRAEKHLQDSVDRAGIPVVWNTAVEEIVGDEGKVTGLRLKDTETGATRELEIDGVFVAVGYIPHNELAKELGVELDATGFIVTDRSMRTNIPGVYACGDVTG
ncbi:MAG: FAD-dependent oxidoreductase, partial [Proteobacteria bacterium]|nr:FAD-dependent oxidoreductase [Pseudomonadota bacterium]